jgi:hypothetical protein
MIRVVAIAALFAVGTAYGIGPIGVGGYHILGLPMGESTITEATMTDEGQSFTATVNMTDGYSWKMGLVNFGFGGVVYFIPMLAAEGGFEMHTGYKNKAGTIKGTATEEGETDPFEWVEKEDNVTWKMMNIYFGPRFAYPLNPSFRILGRGGFLYSLSSKLEYDTEFIEEKMTGVSAKGTHLGAYFGGGLNYFVTPAVAITGMYTYNMLFEGTYTYSGVSGDLPEDLEEKWKPAPYVTVATGVEFYF